MASNTTNPGTSPAGTPQGPTTGHAASTNNPQVCRCASLRTNVTNIGEGDIRWINQPIPAPQAALHKDNRRVGTGEAIRMFAISYDTPLLDGTGSGKIRGLVVSSSPNENWKKGQIPNVVKLNWGMLKWMPEPTDGQILSDPRKNSDDTKTIKWSRPIWLNWNPSWSSTFGKPREGKSLSGEVFPMQTLYVFAFQAMIWPNRSGEPASGWIPIASLLSRFDPQSFAQHAAKLVCMLYCMKKFDDQFDTTQKDTNPGKFRDSRYPRLMCRLAGASDEQLEKAKKFKFTQRGSGDATHYLARLTDDVSPKGYVNLCFNLPDLRSNVSTRDARPGKPVNIGGMACDVFPIGKGVKVYRSKIKKEVKNKDGKKSMVFYYCAVRYRAWRDPGNPLNSNGFSYRFGWIAKAALTRA